MSGNAKTVAVVIKDPEQASEGLRSTAGLLLANHNAAMFVLDFEVEASEKYKEDLEFLLEMEGLAYTNLPANAAKLPLELLSDEAVVEKLRANQVLIPF